MQYNIVFGGLLLTAGDGPVSMALQSSFFFHAYEILMVNGRLPFVQCEMVYFDLLLLLLKLLRDCRISWLRIAGLQPFAFEHGIARCFDHR